MYYVTMVPVGPAQAGPYQNMNSGHAQNEYSGYHNATAAQQAPPAQYGGMHQHQPEVQMAPQPPTSFAGYQAACSSQGHQYGYHQQSQVHMQGAPSAFGGGGMQSAPSHYPSSSMRADAPAFTGSSMQSGGSAMSAHAPPFSGSSMHSGGANMPMQAQPFSGGSNFSSQQAYGGEAMQASPAPPGGGAGHYAPYAGGHTHADKTQQLRSFDGQEHRLQSQHRGAETVPLPQKASSKALAITDPRTGHAVGGSANDSRAGAAADAGPTESTTKPAAATARPVSIVDPQTGAIIAMRAEGSKAFTIMDPNFTVGASSKSVPSKAPLVGQEKQVQAAQRPMVKLSKVSDLIQSAVQSNDDLEASAAGKTIARPKGATHGPRKRWADDDSESQSTASWIGETRSWIGEGSEDKSTPTTQSPRLPESKPIPTTQEQERQLIDETTPEVDDVSRTSLSDVTEAKDPEVQVEGTAKLETQAELKAATPEADSDGGFIQVKSKKEKKGDREAAAKAKAAVSTVETDKQSTPNYPSAGIDAGEASEVVPPRTSSPPAAEPCKDDANGFETRTASLPSKIPGATAKSKATKSRPSSLPSKECTEDVDVVQVQVGVVPLPRGATDAPQKQLDAGAADDTRTSSMTGMTPGSRGSTRSLRRGDSFMTREEDIKRQVLSLLNKLCPENLQVIISKVCAIDISSSNDLTLLLRCIVSKALVDPHYCDAYADLIFSIQSKYPEFPSENGGKPVCFKPVLLNICQAEFESMPKDLRPSAEELANCNPEEISQRTKRRKDHILANMRFIGKLFLRKLLPAAVIGSVMKELMLCDNIDKVPEEHCVECVLELLFAVGLTLEESLVGRQYLTLICGRLTELRKQTQTKPGVRNPEGIYSKRIQFAIQDLLQTRVDGWQKKSFKLGAKTKDAVRREQEQDEAGRGNPAAGEVIIAGQRPGIMEDKTPTTQARHGKV